MRRQTLVIGAGLLVLLLFGGLVVANFTSGSEELMGRFFPYQHGMRQNEQIDSEDDHCDDYLNHDHNEYCPVYGQDRQTNHACQV